MHDATVVDTARARAGFDVFLHKEGSQGRQGQHRHPIIGLSCNKHWCLSLWMRRQETLASVIVTNIGVCQCNEHWCLSL